MCGLGFWSRSGPVSKDLFKVELLYRGTLLHHLIFYALNPVCSGCLRDDVVGTTLYPTVARPCEHHGL